MQEYESDASRWAFLAPWTARLCAAHSPRIKLRYASEHTYRRTFYAIEMALDGSFEDEADAHGLAEAVELVATALAACPTAWRAILVDQLDCNDFTNPHDEPLVARVAFDCSEFLAAYLLAPLGQQFFFALMDARALRSDAFMTSRHHLGLIAGDALKTTPPVAITLHLVPNRGMIYSEQCHAFVRALSRYSRSGHTTRSWCVLETIDFDGVDPAIASEMLDCMEEWPLATVSRLTIHPQDILYLAAECRTFFTALMHTYPEVEFEVSDVPHSFNRGFDGDALRGRSDTIIALVMETLAATGVPLKCLRIGTLHDQEARRVMWNHLFGSLLHPHATSMDRMEHLDLSAHFQEEATDVELMRGAATTYAGYIAPRMLTLSNANLAGLCAIVSVFKTTLRHLTIVEATRPILSETVEFILEACPKLEYLDLNNVMLDTMDVFVREGLGPSSLSTLSLTNVTLRYPSSMEAFLTQLADAQSSVGRRLGEFRLTRAGDPAIMWDRFVLNTTHLPLLANALRANGSIHTVDVEVEDETPDAVMLAFMTEHRRPAAVQRCPLALGCKLAYLSATTHATLTEEAPSARHALNHDITAHVFEYAAECVTQWVHVGKSCMEIHV